MTYYKDSMIMGLERPLDGKYLDVEVTSRPLSIYLNSHTIVADVPTSTGGQSSDDQTEEKDEKDESNGHQVLYLESERFQTT